MVDTIQCHNLSAALMSAPRSEDWCCYDACLCGSVLVNLIKKGRKPRDLMNSWHSERLLSGRQRTTRWPEKMLNGKLYMANEMLVTTAITKSAIMKLVIAWTFLGYFCFLCKGSSYRWSRGGLRYFLSQSQTLR